MDLWIHVAKPLTPEEKLLGTARKTYTWNLEPTIWHVSGQ